MTFKSKFRLFVLTAIFLLPITLLNAQISLEQQYAHSGTFTNLSVSGYKLYIMDVGANQCRIYNMNHSLWKTINLSVPADHYLYDIKYVSENLFTTNNNLALMYIYYIYDEVGQYYTYTTKVVTESGTELLSVPGGQYAYVYNIPDEGTKLIIYAYDYSVFPYTIQMSVYDLPGQLLSVPSVNGATTENAYPNPASEVTTIPFSLPDGADEGLLILTDDQGKVVQKYTVDRQFDKLIVHTATLPRGIYFYYLQADGQKSGSGKLVVN